MYYCYRMMGQIRVLFILFLTIFLCAFVVAEGYLEARHVTFLNLHFKKARQVSSELKYNKIDQKTALGHFAKSLAECRKVQTLVSEAIKSQGQLHGARTLRLIQAHNLLESYLIAQILSDENDKQSKELSAMLERRLLYILPTFSKPSTS